MSVILSIETSTTICSIALHREAKLISLVELDTPGVHAEKIMLLIEEAVQKAGISFPVIEAVAVSEGPGSYTGLRIGVSTAKGLAYGLGIPLIGINTLQGIASAVDIKVGQTIIPVLDARRMEVYSQVFDSFYRPISEIESVEVNEDSYQNYLEKSEVFFIGDAVSKIRGVISNKNAHFLDGPKISARHLGKLAFQKFKEKQFEDLAYFVPNYLKEFKALHSKKNPLLNL